MRDRVKELLLNRNLLILLIATVGMLPELIESGGFYIKGDITHQLLPFLYETKRMFASGTPFWSWNTCMGDNFIASYAYYSVFNPFSWINCLFPYKYLSFGFTFVLYLKFLVCGYISQRYLREIGFDRKLSLIGCLLYTFSSWAVSNLIFYFFMEPMILLPFLLIFVERFLHGKGHSCSGLVFAVFIVVLVNYYFAVINLIVAWLYFLCRLTYCCFRGHEKLRLLIKEAGCVFLGILCASVVVIPVAFQLRGYSSILSDFDFSDMFMWADRVFWLVYPKAHEGRFFYAFLNSGWKSNAASIAVFGLLPVILYYKSKGYAWIKWLTAVLLLIYLTPLNGVFSLFSDSYYTRWAYALTLCFIICTLFYLRDFGLPSFRSVIWYCIIVYGFYSLFSGVSIFWQYRYAGDFASTRILRLVLDLILMVVNAFSLVIICMKTKKGGPIKYLLIAVFICTYLQFFVYTLQQSDWIDSESGEISETDFFIRHEEFHSEDFFSYRSNFKVETGSGRPSCNFGLICNRPSIGTYHSVMNVLTKKWNNIVGDSVFSQRAFYPENFVESFEALMSVKDLIHISDKIEDGVVDSGRASKRGLFSVYESDHYIPMGFTYDKYVITDSIEELAHSDRQADIPKLVLSALAIKKSDEKELSQYLRKGDIGLNVSLDSLVEKRRVEVCKKFEGNSMGFDADIFLDSARVVFFSVLADDGFSAYIDGEPTRIFETNLGLSSVIVPAGRHEISFRYLPPGIVIGSVLSLMGFLITAFMFIKRL